MQSCRTKHRFIRFLSQFCNCEWVHIPASKKVNTLQCLDPLLVFFSPSEFVHILQRKWTVAEVKWGMQDGDEGRRLEGDLTEGQGGGGGRAKGEKLFLAVRLTFEFFSQKIFKLPSLPLQASPPAQHAMFNFMKSPQAHARARNIWTALCAFLEIAQNQRTIEMSYLHPIEMQYPLVLLRLNNLKGRLKTFIWFEQGRTDVYLSHMIRYHTALSMHCAHAYVLKGFWQGWL